MGVKEFLEDLSLSTQKGGNGVVLVKGGGVQGRWWRGKVPVGRPRVFGRVCDLGWLGLGTLVDEVIATLTAKLAGRKGSCATLGAEWGCFWWEGHMLEVMV